MRSSYKDIPKNLRKHYNSEILKSLKRAVWAYFHFNRLYKKRYEIFDLGEIQDNLDLPLNHDYWYCNNTERFNGVNSNELSYIRCWYGDEGYQLDEGFDYASATERQKKRQAKKWIRRNNDWNNKARVGLKFRAGFFVVGEPLVNTGGYPATTWRNETKHGEQSVILRLKGTGELYYRYSYTLPLKRFNPLRLLNYEYVNVMRGVDSRYLWKTRLFKKKTMSSKTGKHVKIGITIILVGIVIAFVVTQIIKIWGDVG